MKMNLYKEGGQRGWMYGVGASVFPANEDFNFHSEEMDMQQWGRVLCMAILGLFIAVPAFATTKASMDVTNEKNKQENVKCVNCHLKENNSMVQQWRNSPQAAGKDGSVAC